MASEGSWFPAATPAPERESIRWDDVEWADAGAFTDAEHDTPDGEERRFYTIAIRRGRVPGTETASVALLGVTDDLEIGRETRLAATVEDGEWTIRDHDGIPASVCERPPADSEIPEARRKRFREVFERAHIFCNRDVEPCRFETAREIATDGGQTTPLPAQKRCANGHLCASEWRYCPECGDGFETGEEEPGIATDGGRSGTLREVFRRETIVEAPDGLAVGEAAVPARISPDPADVRGGED